MKIIVGADPFALGLKNAIVKHLTELGHDVVDQDGAEGADYWESAQKACAAIQSGQVERGILLCGTGMGMSIVANKFPGIRASCVESVFAAKMCRAINDSNVLTMGAMIFGEFMALKAVDAWLATTFTEGLDGVADFLRGAAVSVAAIDDQQRGV